MKVIVNYFKHHAPHNNKFSILLILRNIKSVLNIHFCEPGTPFLTDSCTKNYFNVHIDHKTKESVDN